MLNSVPVLGAPNGFTPLVGSASVISQNVVLAPIASGELKAK